MFDKIIIKGRINTDDIDSIVLRNYLEQCTDGDEVFYRSTAYANFDGCFIEVRGDRIKCRCSINKLYYKERDGKLDNSKPMTFRNAVRTIQSLLMRLYLKPEDTIVTYYELGLTLKLQNPATEYINAVTDISDRILWNDANYPKDRQKTTEKSKYYRKILKIYDKTFESKEKGREVGNNILRIETIYRHQSIKLNDLVDPINLHKIGKIFYEDWLNIRFVRELVPMPGIKMSQLEKAREIHRIGIQRYKKKYKSMYLERKITKKQWETIRNFARAWPKESEKYKEEETEMEREYKDKLLSAYQIGCITPFTKKI